MPRQPRGPYQRVVHPFEAKEILTTPIKNVDVLSHFLFERSQHGNKPNSAIAKKIAEHIINTFPSENLLSFRQLERKIENLWTKYYNLLKHPEENEGRLSLLFADHFVIMKNTDGNPVSAPVSVSASVSTQSSAGVANEQLNITNQQLATATANEPLPAAIPDDDHPHVASPPLPPPPSRNMTDVRLVGEVGLRYGVTAVATAAISTATLVAYGVVTADDRHNVVDRQKVSRAEKALLKKAEIGGWEKFSQLDNIYFDSKKITGLNDRKEAERQNIYVFVHGPKGKFFFSTVCDGESAEDAAQMIISEFSKRELILSKIYLVGVDGTNVNTGVRNGIIRKLEEYVQHPIQWIICLLHSNELPLRKLFVYFDGDTTGPRSFSGPIGRIIIKKGHLHTLPVCRFTPITSSNPLPNVDRKILSKDQQYLFDIWQAVTTGIVSDSMKNREVGRIHHARFLNLGSSCCRLYVSEENPSEELKTLVKFVVEVYAPCFFQIKCYPKIYDGSRHLFKLFLGIKSMGNTIYELLLPVVLNNGYFFHVENILLAMLVDNDAEVRLDALNKIKDARSRRPSTLRVFKKPNRDEINEDAHYYYEILRWDIIDLFSPPILDKLSTEEITRMISGNLDELKFHLDYLNHTQPVERGIKDLTSLSSKLKPDERDSAMRIIEKSRRKMPSFRTKGEFNLFKPTIDESSEESSDEFSEESSYESSEANESSNDSNESSDESLMELI